MPKLMGPIQTRVDLYGIVAACLRAEPSKSTLVSLSEQLPVLKERMKSWDEPKLREAVESMVKALKVSPKALATDYAGLFLVGIDGAKCPSESAYLEKVVYGQSTMEVMEIYTQHGFIKESSFKEPEDHIALECAFMATLGEAFLSVYQKSGITSSRGQKALQAQIQFLEQHVSRWIPLWSKAVEKSAKTAFFRAVAILTHALVEADRRLLSGLAKPAQERVRRKRKG